MLSLLASHLEFVWSGFATDLGGDDRLKNISPIRQPRISEYSILAMFGSGSPATINSPWRVHGSTLMWTTFVCLVLLLPGGGLQPGGSLPWGLPDGTDKLIHSFLFFFETLFLFRSLRIWRSNLPPLATAIAVAFLLGAVTEVAQLGVPHRSGDVADWLADALGALAFGAWVSRPGAAGSRSTL